MQFEGRPQAPGDEPPWFQAAWFALARSLAQPDYPASLSARIIVLVGKARIRLAWALVLAVGVALVGLSVYLVRLGLQSRTNQILTVLGSLSGIVGAGLSVFSLVAARNAAVNNGKNIQEMENSPRGIQIIGDHNAVDRGEHE